MTGVRGRHSDSFSGRVAANDNAYPVSRPIERHHKRFGGSRWRMQACDRVGCRRDLKSAALLVQSSSSRPLSAATLPAVPPLCDEALILSEEDWR